MVIPILITTRSVAHRDDAEEDEVLSLVTSGEMELMDNRAIIRYEETVDESVPSQQVELEITPDSVLMSRKGVYATQMMFREGCRFEGSYTTPYGHLQLAVFTTELSCDIGEDGGELSVSYQLDINGGFVAMHMMEVHLTSKECPHEMA